jgi:hypothetical protein
VLLPAALLARAACPVPAAAAGSSGATSAAFADPYDVPSAPRPPTLPELTHGDIEVTLETTAGALLPAAPGGTLTHAYVQRLEVEVPLGLRRWYVGAQYQVAAGTTEGSLTAIGSNLALEGRTLWATRTGLAFGGGLRLLAPTAAFDPNGRAAAVALEAATLRPWDVGFFVPDALGVHPFVDVRVLDGPFVAQFRQGLDGTLSTASAGDRRLYATTSVYVGWRVTGAVASGLELFEAYAIDVPGVRDGARSAIIVSPNVRLALPWVQPAVSLFTNVGTPLEGSHGSIWGFRLAFTLVYDPSSSTLGSLRTSRER